MKRSLIIGAAAAAVLLQLGAAHAQVSIGVRTPEFAFRIGAPGPVYAPAPYYGAPMYGPPVYGPPVYGPSGFAPPAYGPVFAPAPVFVQRPRVYVPAPVYVAPPRWVAVPRGYWGGYRAAPGYVVPRHRIAPGPSYGPPPQSQYHGEYARWVPPGHAKRN